MPIIRVNKRENVAFFDKTVLNDKRLSCKAKGIAAMLLSHPNQWEIRTSNIINSSKDGKDSVQAGLRELEDAGYLIRKRLRKPDGTWTYEQTLREVPHADSPERDFPAPDNPAI